MPGKLFQLSRMRGDQRGVATVEFALWVTSFFLVVMAALDFGAFYLERGKLNEAVGAAAVASFGDAEKVNFNDMPGYVRGIAQDQSATVTLSCNGTAGSCTNFSRTCACLKQDGTYVANSCGNICTGTGVTSGSTAGYYFTISASRDFDPILLPQGVLGDTNVSQQATIRLQ